MTNVNTLIIHGGEKIEILKSNLLNRIALILSILFLLSISFSAVNAAETGISSTDNLGQTVENATNNAIINLDTGTYTTNVTNITINKNLTIQGKNQENTIIDAQNIGRIFFITPGNTLTLINITLINGNTTTDYWGGVIYNEGILSITNCNFINNTATYYGGAIYNEGILSITNCIFTNNNALYRGGAICTDNIASITNCNFTNNKAEDGGAIYSSSYSSIDGVLSIDNCNFANNIASNDGGAIFSSGSNNNKVTIIQSIFRNNTAYNGGAIYSDYGYFDIIGSSFINNSAIGSWSRGGALVLSSANIINSSFIDNKAEYAGGAIYNYYGTTGMHIISSNFTGNTAINGGAIILTNATDTTINDSILTNNTAEVGSAIYKGLYDYNSNLTVNNSNFTDNNGGSVLYLFGNETKVTGCNIFNNSQGILIPENSDATINYNRIFNNTNKTGYNLDDGGFSSNLDFNWWGDNHPKVNGTLNNYFVMNVINLTSLDSNGTVTFQYTFKLNNGDPFNASLLPYFVTNVYTNLTSGIIESFDARFDNVFDVTVNTSGDILYTFITDNEVQTLEGTTTIPDPVDPINPIYPVDPDDTINTRETSNNPTANAAVMKESGIPIIAILIMLISSLGLISRKK